MDFVTTNFNFEENEFYFHNNQLKCLKFVLDCDSEDKFFYKLLTKFHADVIDIPNEHTMVLANPDETTYHDAKIPAFDIKYIEDCFTLKHFPDPTKYIIKNSCPVKYTRQNVFDCWFHKTKSWLYLLPVRNDIKMHRFKYKSIIYNKQMLKKLAMSYTRNEDARIVRYIAKHNEAFNIREKSMWIKMENANVCKFRSWQSMKERYLKFIKSQFTFDLEKIKSGSVFTSFKYPFLSPESIIQLQRGLGIVVSVDPEILESLLNVLIIMKNFFL